jgi:PKD repeat protein
MRAQFNLLDLLSTSRIRFTGLCITIASLLMSGWMQSDAHAAQVTLRWDYAASGAAGFMLYCGPSSRNYPTRIDVGNTDTYTIGTLAVGTTSFCAVTAYDPAKVESDYSNELSIYVPSAAPIVDFTASPASGTAPLSVAFTNTTTGQVTNWAWSFGDGTTSTAQSPTHVYSAPGSYKAVLTATGPGGTASKTAATAISVAAPAAPAVSFTASPASGTAPVSVVFTNTTTGQVTSWAWNFGDGTTSIVKSPTHVYSTAGSYKATLTATGPGGTVSKTAATAVRVSASNDTTPPSTPAGPAATPVSSTQIKLAWTASSDNVGVTGYRIERCPGAACTNFVALVATSTATSFTDTGLTPATTYRYRVRAADAAGNLSGYSSVASAITQAGADTTSPTVPTALTAKAASTSRIDLTWTASTDNVGVTVYRVERCQGATCTNFAEVGTATGTSYGNTGLASNTAYRFRVRAADALGNLSAYSSVAGVATLSAAQAGLVAAYGLNEGSGSSVADVSGNNNKGTLTSGVTWTTQGKFGKALVFNGFSGRVDIIDAPSLRLTTAMTLEAWVNPTTVSSAWRDVVYKGNDNYYLMATSSQSSVPAGRVGANRAYGTSPLATNTWTHLAVTYDHATLRLYVNGVQVSSVAYTGNITTSANPLQIGGDSIYGQYFQGLIDEVRVYNRALSQAEIKTDMNTAVSP